MAFHRRLAILVIVWTLAIQFGNGSGWNRFTKVDLVDPWFIILEDSENRPGYLANIISDQSLWSDAKNMGIQHIVFDIELPQAQPYLDDVEKHGKPAFVFISNKKLLHSGTVPKDSASVRKIFNQEW